MIRISHDHVLTWDGPKCLWFCTVGECEYFVYDERLNVPFPPQYHGEVIRLWPSQSTTGS